MTDSLYREYAAGNRDAVWYRLHQLGSRVRVGNYREDAQAVVREAITRALSNVTTIVDRLRAHAYEFGDAFADDGATVPHSPPDEQSKAFADWLEGRFGPVPMTARAWIEIVGDVSLLGRHPDWPPDVIADPLVVEFEYKSWSGATDRTFGRHFHENEYEAWSSSLAEDGPAIAGPFCLDVAPDALHKANISGGAPYGIVVPDMGADGRFRYDDDVYLPFVEYLRLAFANGGFPGLARRGPSALADWCKRELAAELLPL